VVTVIDTDQSPYVPAISPDDHVLYVGLPDVTETLTGPRSVIAVIDTASNGITATVHLDSVAYAVAFTPDGSVAYVAANDRLDVIDTATNQVRTVLKSAQPRGIAIGAGGSRAYVSAGVDSTLEVIDLPSGSVQDTVSLQASGIASPGNVVLTSDGRTAYVLASLQTYDPAVAVIDTATNTVTTAVDLMALGAVAGDDSRIAISPDDRSLYVTSGNAGVGAVTVLDSATLTVRGNILVEGDPAGIAVAPGGGVGYVTSVEAGYPVHRRSDCG